MSACATDRLKPGTSHFRSPYLILRSIAVLTSVRQDIHYAIRSFRQAPGLALAIIVSIGLGIGANTTVFSVVTN
jgi:hypothetical protein